MYAIFKEDRVTQPLSTYQNWSRPKTEHESRVVAGNVWLSGSDPTGDTVASICAPAARLSERGACDVARMAPAQKGSARARSVR